MDLETYTSSGLLAMSLARLSAEDAAVRCAGYNPKASAA